MEVPEVFEDELVTCGMLCGVVKHVKTSSTISGHFWEKRC